MTIKTVIADDELLARDRIRRLLSVDQNFEVIEECRSGAELLNTLLSRDVDLVLLDIHMPGLSGLDAVKQMDPAKLPLIVFITAHDKYAINAFEMNAVDYLLKPIESERFHEAIERVKDRARMKTSLDTQETLASVLTALESFTASATRGYMPRFVVHSGSKDLFVNVDEVAWVEAADYYVCLHVAEKKHLLRESIKKLEGELDPHKFIRIHRSAIVNVNYVREIHREGRSEGWVLLSNGDRVRMSTAGWQKLLSASTTR